MLQSVAPNTLHTFAVDLPIALVLLGPLLFVIAAMGKDRGRRLIVPAVMLSILGASSLFAFYLDTYTAASAIRYGGGREQVLPHLQELGYIATKTFVAMSLLFAGAFLLSRLTAQLLSKTALQISSAVFAVVNILCSVWLLVIAHKGANLAVHLAKHVSR